MRTLTITAIFLLLLSSDSIAQDRYFGRTYTSDVLPKGSVDMELWHTSRFGHSGQFFHAQDQRMEIEFGLGKKLQTSVYFNRYQKRFSETADGTTVSNEIGFSNEWKYKVSDAAANKLGFALYGEWGFKGGDELELETKLIFDKRFGKSLLAFNTSLEFEKEFEWSNNKVESDNWALPLEFDLAYLYFAKPGFGIGAEVRNINDISKDNGRENSVLYAGPTVRFTGSKWFLIANYQPQIANLHKTATAPFSKDLAEHERAEARIIVGVSF